MTPYEAIVEYLGQPQDHEFNQDEYLGRYGGMINIVGLRHKGIVMTGGDMYKLVSQHFGVKFNRWDFLQAFNTWCAEYTDTQEEEIPLGKRNVIQKGLIYIEPASYFCVPASLGASSV
jgi:hypothetical protein